MVRCAEVGCLYSSSRLALRSLLVSWRLPQKHPRLSRPLLDVAPNQTPHDLRGGRVLRRAEPLDTAFLRGSPRIVSLAVPSSLLDSEWPEDLQAVGALPPDTLVIIIQADVQAATVIIQIDSPLLRQPDVACGVGPDRAGCLAAPEKRRARRPHSVSAGRAVRTPPRPRGTREPCCSPRARAPPRGLPPPADRPPRRHRHPAELRRHAGRQLFASPSIAGARTWPTHLPSDTCTSEERRAFGLTLTRITVPTIDFCDTGLPSAERPATAAGRVARGMTSQGR